MGSERLDPLVTTLLEVMTNPELVVTIDVAGARSPRLATVWGSPRRAVLGMTDDRRQFELVQIEPALLPFHLAQTTGLRPRPHPPFSGGFSLPTGALARAEELIGADSCEAERELRSAGVPSPWADRLLIALANRRSMWTVEAVWLGTKAAADIASLSVLDAGPAGYWRLESGSEHAEITVAISDFDDLLRRFSALLPPSVEI